MAAINVVLNGVIVDLYGRVISGPVKIMGELMYSDRGVGGGPMPPGQGSPPGIWGGPIDPYPDHGLPGHNPPGTGIWGPGDPRPQPPIANVPGLPPSGNPPGFGQHPSHPISLPGDPWWPGEAPQPPEMPPPGSPPSIIPGTTPVNPINPPPAIVVDYPGIGKVLVPQPVP